MTDKMQPCPWCGETPELETRDVEPQGDPWYGGKEETFVLCKCGACLFDGEFHEGFYDAETRAVEAWNRRAAPSPGMPTAKQRYAEANGDEEPSALERLRFFCSLAMNGQDWLDIEPFFAALHRQEQAEKDAEAFVRDLLWNDHMECCGSPVVGAEYMGQQEMICCGCPDPALLSDAQIVASLRAKFPAPPTAASGEGAEK